jgi:hypothetical protein
LRKIFFSFRLYTAFLHPNGRISHFFIPFHTLSTSSSAEKDLKTQARIHQLLQGNRSQSFIQSITDDLESIKNIQLKTYLVSSLLLREQHGFSSDEAAALVSSLISRCRQEEKNLPLELQLYARKLAKLAQLIGIFQQLEKLEPTTKHLIRDKEQLAELVCQLSVDSSYLDTLFLMVKDTTESAAATPDLQFSFCDFLACFELEGELQSAEK